MKKIIIITYLCLCLFGFSFAGNDFEIVPKATDSKKVSEVVEKVGASGGNVWKTYNDEGKKMDTIEKLGDQMASGIMTWNTLINYVVYVIRFLSQIGLLIGAVMVIYAGYLYATTVFGGDPNKGKSAIKNAIIGVLVIAFSYAIMKFLTSAFIT